MKKITLSWMEYTHKIKGYGAIEIMDELSHRAFMAAGREILRDGIENYLGIYQQLAIGDEAEIEVDQEAIKQILHYYIDNL